MEFFFEKNFGEVLDQYQLPIRRNFEYLEKNGVFKFFKSLHLQVFRASCFDPSLSLQKFRCNSVFQLYLVNFKWLKFIPPTANSCYLGQNISWGQKIFQKFWFLDIPMSCQSFLKNHLVKWPLSAAIWSGKRKFYFLCLFEL